MRKVFANVRKRTFFVLAIELQERWTLSINRVTAIRLRYILALSHNATCCGEKLLLLEIIALLGIKKPLSQLIVIALVTFKPPSLQKVIALTAKQKTVSAECSENAFVSRYLQPQSVAQMSSYCCQVLEIRPKISLFFRLFVVMW
jgi:hypothetical protein